MDRKLYLIPAVVSLGLHGLLILGAPEDNPRTEAIISTLDSLCEKPPLLETFIVPPPPPEVDNRLVVELPQPLKGEPRPALEELIQAKAPGSFEMEVPPTTPGAFKDATIIGPPGVPEGIEGGDAFATVLPTVVSADFLDSTPTARLQARPHYPTNARSQGLTGTVLVDFVVNERGEVVRVSVLNSSNAIFEEPTKSAVYRWRFAPGLRNGKPVSFKMRIPVSFNLDA